MRPQRTPAELRAVAERRRQLAPGAPAGATEGMIEAMVHTFYGRIREDETLGPVFGAHVSDWDEHLAKLCDFWSSVLLMTGRFKGSPMAAHVRVSEIETAHFGRWLEIWRTTARDVCPPAAAEVFIERAEMIGRSLQLGLAASRGELPPLVSAAAGQADERRSGQDEDARQDKGGPGPDA